MRLTPLPKSEIIRVFGDPTPHIGLDGRILSSWEQSILTTIVLPAPLRLAWNLGVTVTRVRCHRLIAPHLGAAFRDLHRNPEVWATLDDFAGCYCFRGVRGAIDTLSSHAWAISIDMDARENKQGTSGRVHPKTIEIMERHGFLYGGRFSGKRRDPMHYEFFNLSLLEGAK